jgi:hypothetical protein
VINSTLHTPAFFYIFGEQPTEEPIVDTLGSLERSTIEKSKDFITKVKSQTLRV